MEDLSVDVLFGLCFFFLENSSLGYISANMSYVNIFIIFFEEIKY